MRIPAALTALSLTLASVTNVADAQPATTAPTPTADASPAMPPPPPPVAQPLPTTPPPVHHRSPGVGVGLAVVGTIVPAIGFGIGVSLDSKTGSQIAIGSVVGGLVLPSLGLIYAQRRRSIGMYPRSAALVVLVLGLLVDGLGDSKEAGNYYAVSAALYGIGSGIDIVMTPAAVRAYNRNEGVEAFKVRIGATAMPGGGGLALGGRF